MNPKPKLFRYPGSERDLVQIIGPVPIFKPLDKVTENDAGKIVMEESSMVQ